MEVRIQIPDDVAAQIQSNGGDAAQRVRSVCPGRIQVWAVSAYQVEEVLGFETPMEVDGFLKSHGVYLDYTEEALGEDLTTSRRVSSQHRAE